MKQTKKLLVGFSMCMALSVGISMPQTAQAADSDFVIEDEAWPSNSIGDTEIQDWDAGNYDFVIENSVLTKYTGNGGDVVIPDGVTKIGNGAFQDCRNLVSVIIPDGVTEIGNNAFWWCSNLTGIVIPNGVRKIGDDAFCFCNNLTSVVIPNGVTKIGNSVFYGCTNLVSVTIPDSVTEIGEETFYNCNSLTNIKIPSSVKDIGESAFLECSSLANIVLPPNITCINSYTFCGCKSLSEITVPKGVTTIGESAFYECIALSSVNFPDTLTKIGEEAFEKCYNLSKIILPNGVPIDEVTLNNVFSGHTNIIRSSGEIINKYFVISSHKEFVCLVGEFSRGELPSITIDYSALGIEPSNADSILMDHRLGAYTDNCSLAEVMFQSESVSDSHLYNDPFCFSLTWQNGQKARLRELEVEKKADEILNSILTKNMSQKEKVIEIANWLIDNVEYDYDAVESYYNNPNAFMAYGALDDKKAVCEGFSKGFNLLARKAGIPSILATSNNKSDVKNHAWNIYRLNGKYYEIDTTFHMGEGKLYEGISIHKEFEEQGYYKTFMDYVSSVDFTIPITNTKSIVTPKRPNKGTILKFKNSTYTVTKKGSEVAYTKISSVVASVNIPNTVKIGGITYKVTSVSPNAFKGNKKLSKVTIGANITSIGKNAFNGCKNLKTITIKSKKLKSVGNNAFKGIKSTAKIKVPSKQLKAYKKLLKGKGQGKKVKITK